MRRRLIIGDIHGCYDELQALLDRAGVSAHDEIIAVGDIVDRGPDSPRVLDFFRAHRFARSVLGNHERKHVRSSQGLTPAALSQQLSRRQWGDAYEGAVATLAAFPTSLVLDEAIVVHAYWEPGVALGAQRETVIVGTLQGDAYLARTYAQPWYTLYDGPRPLIVGHCDYLQNGQPLIYRDTVYCLDTGCYSGRALTGLLLPEFRLISVPSRADYWTAAKRQARESAAALDAHAARALAHLYDHIMGETARVLAELRAEGPFDDLAPAEQGRLFAARIGPTPLAGWLHRARTGRLTLDDVRRRYRTPEAVQQALADGGLAPPPSGTDSS